LTFGFFVKNPRVNEVLAYIPALNWAVSINNSGNVVLFIEGVNSTTDVAKAYQTITGSVDLGDGEYHHVCVSVDLSEASGSRKINLYIDGAEDGTQITNSTLESSEFSQNIKILIGTKIIGFTGGVFTGSAIWTFLSNTPPLGFGVTGSLSVVSGYGFLTSAAANYITSTNSMTFNNAAFSTVIRFRAIIDSYAQSSSLANANDMPLGIRARSDAADRSFRVVFTSSSVSVVDNDTSPSAAQTIKLDTTIEHQYDIVVKNNSVQLYVDGALAITQLLSSSDATAGDVFQLGFLNTNATGGSISINSLSINVINTVSSGLYDVSGLTGTIEISEPFISTEYFEASDNFLESLQTDPVETLVLRDIKNYIPFFSISYSGLLAAISTSSTPATSSPFLFYGDGESDFLIQMYFHSNSEDPSFSPRVILSKDTSERFAGRAAASVGGSIFATEGSANTETGVISGCVGIYLQSPTLISPFISVFQTGSIGIFTLYGFNVVPVRKG